jgi:hypothetical protein
LVWLTQGAALAAASTTHVDALYTVQGAGQQAVVRLLTPAKQCPAIRWDRQAAVPMAERAGPETVPQRAGGEQKEGKDAVFGIRVCEAPWPQGAKQGRVAGLTVPAPKPLPRRIVLIGDTGCRMKGSEKAYQPCNDAKLWPLARVARSAAALKPDLVVHVGDIHYRETPCDTGQANCAHSPWGYGYDAWKADLFTPAKALLRAAPWVFVRGNHEVCTRAGQGWFRFIDVQGWSAARSCNDPALDGDANFTPPYAVPVTGDTQLIVFDSSAAKGKPYAATDPAHAQYAQQLAQVAQLAQAAPHSFFLSHHPLFAAAPLKEGKSDLPKGGGTAGLQSVFAETYPQRLLPPGVEVALHGHIHLFQALSFKGDQPVSLVLGNSGSVNEGAAPQALPAGFQAYPGAEVEEYHTRADYGFALLERDDADGGAWRLTEYAPDGKAQLHCRIAKAKAHCTP